MFKFSWNNDTTNRWFQSSSTVQHQGYKSVFLWFSWLSSHYHKKATTAPSVLKWLNAKQEEKVLGFPFMHVSLFIREVTLSQKVHLPKDLPSGPIHQNWVLCLCPMCKGSWECWYTAFLSFFYHSRILPLRRKFGRKASGEATNSFCQSIWSR